MTTQVRKTLAALAVVLACSACADKTTASLTSTNQLVSSNHWIELTSAQTAAHVSNNSLIMMR